MTANYKGAGDRQSSERYMARGSVTERLGREFMDDGPDPENAREWAEVAVDFLNADGALFLSERWEDDCHTCGKRIGDHLIDGRCP